MELTKEFYHFQDVNFSESGCDVLWSFPALIFGREVPSELEQVLQTLALDPCIMQVVGEVVVATNS